MHRHIEIPIQQFKVLFQVIKEFDNVTWGQTPDFGPQESVDQALRSARDIHRAARKSEASKVVFSDPGPHAPQREELPPVVEELDGVTVVRASAAAGHLPLWPPIVSFVTQSLGEREIFLRTGYRPDEIDSAVRNFPGSCEFLTTDGEVTRVSFDRSVTLLIASGDVSMQVRIESEFSITTPDGSTTSVNPEGGATQLSSALALLRKRVRFVHALKAGALEIEFEGGEAVRVAADPDFEAWCISTPGGTLMVSPLGGDLTTWHPR